jgi:hypothetical protein
MLDVTHELHAPIRPEQYAKVYAALTAIPRLDFSAYRMQIDHALVDGWWWQHAAQALQEFYTDLLMGKRPKLVLKARMASHV